MGMSERVALAPAGLDAVPTLSPERAELMTRFTRSTTRLSPRSGSPGPEYLLAHKASAYQRRRTDRRRKEAAPGETDPIPNSAAIRSQTWTS
jgi:hypothetical protein